MADEQQHHVSTK